VHKTLAAVYDRDGGWEAESGIPACRTLIVAATASVLGCDCETLRHQALVPAETPEVLSRIVPDSANRRVSASRDRGWVAGIVSSRAKKDEDMLMPATQSAPRAEKQPMEIKLAHSPDSDDAFMFYALATHKLATPGYKYTHVLSDIQTLNEAALTETYDVTAVSFAAYPTLRDKYILLDCGASFGENYGPIVVSSKPLRKEELARKRIAVPGLKTTAYLTLKLFEPDFEPVIMPFDKILDAVQSESVEAGLLIHEGQLLFPQLGLHRVLDLGVWWHDKTNLPLPLGGNAVRRALGPALGRQIARTIRESVEYGLGHREEALNYAMQFARDMETETADKFVAMYVNRWTLGYGDRGKQAVAELINRGTAAGLLPGPPSVEFLSEE
jgi:1,4-dihydroxy-6-naphthoate synthase